MVAISSLTMCLSQTEPFTEAAVLPPDFVSTATAPWGTPAAMRQTPAASCFEKVCFRPLPDAAGFGALGSHRPASAVLEEDQRQLLIGRHPDCDLRLDDEGVSMYHARLVRMGQSLQMEVLGGHGMLVGQRWRRQGDTVKVRCGDRIALVCYRKSHSRDRKPLLCWQLCQGQGKPCDDGVDLPRAWITKLPSQAPAQPLAFGGAGMVFGEGLDFTCSQVGSDDGVSSGSTARVFFDQGNFWFEVRASGIAGCFLNEVWLGPGTSEKLRHGDIIVFCHEPNKWLPIGDGTRHTRGCYVFGLQLETTSSVPELMMQTPDREAGPESLTMTVPETNAWQPATLLTPVPPVQAKEEHDPSVTLPLPGISWAEVARAAALEAEADEAQELAGRKRFQQAEAESRPALRRRLEHVTSQLS